MNANSKTALVITDRFLAILQVALVIAARTFAIDSAPFAIDQILSKSARVQCVIWRIQV